MIECSVCDGKTCKGGDNRHCARRNPRKSVIAAILDRYGGVRVVVTHRHLLKNHKRDDEICVTVPHVTLHEPIGWNKIPEVVARAESFLDQWITDNRPNEDWAVEAYKMRQLRKLEHLSSKRALNLEHIVDT
jgi:hypothetical protein